MLIIMPLELTMKILMPTCWFKMFNLIIAVFASMQKMKQIWTFFIKYSRLSI